MGLARELALEAVEEVEVLTRVHREEKVHSTVATSDLGDRLRRELGVDLVPEDRAVVADDHSALAHSRILRSGREEFRVR